jgi:hypothetical protein
MTPLCKIEVTLPLVLGVREKLKALIPKHETLKGEDLTAADTLGRLAVSLADDVQRWSRRRT